MKSSTKTEDRLLATIRVHFAPLGDNKFLTFLSVFGVVAATITGLIMPLYLKNVLNDLAQTSVSEQAAHNAVISIVLVGVFSFLQWMGYRIQSLSTILLESKVMAALYTKSFDYLIRHSYNFFTSEFAGTLTRRVSKYTNAFETVYDTLIMNFFPAAIFVIGASCILYMRSPLLGIILAIWSVVFVALQVLLSRFHRPLRIDRAEKDSKMVGGLSDAISNQNTITLFSGVEYEESRFNELVSVWNKAQIRAWRFMWNIWGIQGLFMIGVNIALLYGGVIFWERGEITVGDFILIQTYLVGTFGMLDGITQQLRRFYDAVADTEEMTAILEKPHEVQDIPDALDITVSKGSIGFKDISFGFADTDAVLKSFSVDIYPGQKVALVGPSGAGKSTITKLLLRFYDPQSGTIEIDGQDIKSVTQESLRNAIGFVPQEPVLFHRSLLENIRYGRRNATEEEVIEAAKKAHCNEFIDKLPLKYETFVGERGIKLSGGERQRVAIARAILKNAPILVLDEATSSLDSESESLIQDSLETLMRGKTVIVIAHRLSTIMKMDRIVVIEKGGVVADGTHDELLQKDGLYQKLWNIQAGGFIQDEESSPQLELPDESEESLEELQS